MSTGSTCVILQPSYIPWRGYFDLIRQADWFVFYDDVQYDKHGWRNRNRIKTSHGPIWLTIPVHARGVTQNHIPINQIKISGRDWAGRHWRTLSQAYAAAPHFDQVTELLAPFYDDPSSSLVEITIPLIVAIAGYLGLSAQRFVRSSDLDGTPMAPTDRLVAITQQLGAKRYLTGPSAKSYLDEARFREAGIAVSYIPYNYPAYSQLHGQFDPQTSIVDLLMMTGRHAGEFIWGNNQQENARGDPNGHLQQLAL